jgi:glycosyltransferase involved in cell wall biosynthesis
VVKEPIKLTKILFLVPYPLHESPSQRFRFEQYFHILEKAGHRYTVQSFLDSGNWKIFFRPGNSFLKLLTLLKGYCRRVMMLFTALSYDFIFIHREATPLGPPLIEYILAKILRRKIIYDFDDAIWMTDRQHEPALLSFLKWRKKVRYICGWSFRVSCGNEYLMKYALQYNKNAVYNPTTIDTEAWHNPELYNTKKNPDIITIGWTGSHSTLKYLNAIEPVFRQIALDFPFVNFLIIADRPPDFSISQLTFKQWNARTEIEDLLAIDIGVMPLPDDEWSKGKCGFKALQYMALKVPAVVSPVGVNTSIVDNGVDGFIASTSDEWYQCLTKLIADQKLRLEMGEHARKKVINHYSVQSNTSTFLSLFT